MIEAIVRKAKESAALQQTFFAENAAKIESCVYSLVERFAAGGRLLCIGNGGSACDAQHVAVEFQHPILEKRRALPALALPNDVALLTAVGNDSDFSRVFADQVELLGRPADALLGISTSGASANVNRALACARKKGLLTIGFAGRDGGQFPELCEFAFVVGSWSIHRIQEVHTTLLHVLWDQLHVAMGEDDVL